MLRSVILFSIAVPAMIGCDAATDAVRAESASVAAVAPLCERNQAAALSALRDPAHGHVILMRHGLAQGKTPLVTGVSPTCFAPHRRLTNTAAVMQVTNMGKLIANVQLSNGNSIGISGVYSSETCRAQATAVTMASAAGAAVNVPVAGLNPPSMNGSAAKTKNWIDGLTPTPGAVFILVSHSDIIPDVVGKFGPRLSAGSVTQSEAVVLRKTTNGFRCVATIPAQ